MGNYYTERIKLYFSVREREREREMASFVSWVYPLCFDDDVTMLFAQEIFSKKECFAMNKEYCEFSIFHSKSVPGRSECIVFSHS